MSISEGRKTYMESSRLKRLYQIISDEVSDAYDRNRGRIIAGTLVTLLISGAYYLKTATHKSYEKGKKEGQIELLMTQRFNQGVNRRYGISPGGLISDPQAGIVDEMRRAFFNGQVLQNPAYSSTGELSDIASLGKEAKQEITARVSRRF